MVASAVGVELVDSLETDSTSSVSSWTSEKSKAAAPVGEGSSQMVAVEALGCYTLIWAHNHLIVTVVTITDTIYFVSSIKL